MQTHMTVCGAAKMLQQSQIVNRIEIKNGELTTQYISRLSTVRSSRKEERRHIFATQDQQQQAAYPNPQPHLTAGAL